MKKLKPAAMSVLLVSVAGAGATDFKVSDELKETQEAYAELQSRPSPTKEREAFLLEELEKVNLQLECKLLWKLNC